MFSPTVPGGIEPRIRSDEPLWKTSSTPCTEASPVIGPFVSIYAFEVSQVDSGFGIGLNQSRFWCDAEVVPSDEVARVGAADVGLRREAVGGGQRAGDVVDVGGPAERQGGGAEQVQLVVVGDRRVPRPAAEGADHDARGAGAVEGDVAARGVPDRDQLRAGEVGDVGDGGAAVACGERGAQHGAAALADLAGPVEQEVACVGDRPRGERDGDGVGDEAAAELGLGERLPGGLAAGAARPAEARRAHQTPTPYRSVLLSCGAHPLSNGRPSGP